MSRLPRPQSDWAATEARPAHCVHTKCSCPDHDGSALAHKRRRPPAKGGANCLLPSHSRWLSTLGRLQVFVQHFTGDAPAPVRLSAPDHEEAPPHPGGVRAFRAAHPGHAPERRREIARPERRDRGDLHRGDADLRRGVEERAPPLDRRRSRSHEDRIAGVEVHPGREIGSLESLGKSLFSCSDGGDVGRRKCQLAERLLRTTAEGARLARPHSGDIEFAKWAMHLAQVGRAAFASLPAILCT
jgi:hypothetical protein